jgi:hypothetical protein
MEGEEGEARMKMKRKVNEINKPNMDCWLLIAPEANGSSFGNHIFGHRGMGRKSKPPQQCFNMSELKMCVPSGWHFDTWNLKANLDLQTVSAPTERHLISFSFVCELMKWIQVVSLISNLWPPKQGVPCALYPDYTYHWPALGTTTVQFWSICHPYVTVTHLTKFSFRHLVWRAMTTAKFHQIGPQNMQNYYI